MDDADDDIPTGCFFALLLLPVASSTVRHRAGLSCNLNNYRSIEKVEIYNYAQDMHELLQMVETTNKLTEYHSGETNVYSMYHCCYYFVWTSSEL